MSGTVVYRDLTFRSDFVVDLPGQDVLVDNCRFDNCGLWLRNANRVWVERCIQGRTAAPTPGQIVYGYYCGGGALTGRVSFHRSEAQVNQLDGFKTATGTSGGVALDDTRSYGNGAWGASEGGGYDLFASGYRVQGNLMASEGNNGVGLVMKAKQDLNPPNQCSDAVFTNFTSDGDVVGIALDALNDLDNPAEGVGTPPPVRRVSIAGFRVTNSVNESIVVGSLETTFTNGYVDNAGLEGVRLTHTARDVEFHGVSVLGAAAVTTGQPLVEIKGSKRIKWFGGTLDGRGIARAALELFDRDGTHLADDIQFLDFSLNGTWTAPGSPPMAAFADVPGFIIRGIGMRPDAGPGLHGGAGSTWTRASTKQRYHKTGAANSLATWNPVT